MKKQDVIDTINSLMREDKYFTVAKTRINVNY